MTERRRTKKDLLLEIEELQIRLLEAEETLAAIQRGEVDAIMGSSVDGAQVYTLQGAEQPYRIFFEAMKEGAVTMDSDGTVLYCNRAFADLAKVPLEKITGMSFLDFVAEDSRQNVAALLSEDGPASRAIETSLKASGNANVPVNISKNALKTTDMKAVYAIVTDLSDLVLMKRLEQSNRKLSDLNEELMVSREALLASEKTLRDSRRAALNLMEDAVTAHKATEAANTELHKVIAERKRVEQALAKKTGELEDLNKNLEVRVEEELRARRRNEQILTQQSKLAAMGEMISAIAHQWRQPLNVVGLIVQNMQEVFEQGKLDSDHMDRSVRKTMAQIEHMSRTIDDFRNFFKPDKEKRVFDTMRAVGDVLSLLSTQLSGDRITCRLTCHSHGETIYDQKDISECAEKTIEGYRNEFEHVVFNLVNNARDAILEKRRSDNGDRSEPGLLSFDFHNRDGRIIVEISDNGSGIPAAVIDRIFEPYFSTKDMTKGTGIGLYMSKVIVEDHLNGALTAKNHEGGAMFTISLPQAWTKGSS